MLLRDPRPSVSRPSRRGRPRVDDYELANRVLDVLEVAERPMSASELRRRVVGQGVKIDHSTRVLVAAGRVVRVGRMFALVRGGGDAA